MMDYKNGIECFLSVIVITVFVILAIFLPEFLVSKTKEDGPLENLSAIFFLAASFFFAVAARKLFLNNARKWKFIFMTIAWSVLMFIFFGEEISWGQRIFDFSTPDSLAQINLQKEFNIHNIAAVDTAFGGKYRYFSVMMLCFSIVFPAMKFLPLGRKLLNITSFPVATYGISLLVLSAYIYGKYFNSILPNDGASEIREFLFSLGVFWFSIVCAYGTQRVYVNFQNRS